MEIFWHNEDVTVHKDVYIGFPTNSSRTFSAFYSFYEFPIHISIKNENILSNDIRSVPYYSIDRRINALDFE